MAIAESPFVTNQRIHRRITGVQLIEFHIEETRDSNVSLEIFFAVFELAE